MVKRSCSRKITFLTFTLVAFCILFVVDSSRASFRSSHSKRLRATVSVSNDTCNPQIEHIPLQRISPVTKIGLITGNVSDNAKINDIVIHYRSCTEISWSTCTITGAGAKNVDHAGNIEQQFSFTVPCELLTGDCEYRITVNDGVNTTVFPATGWQKISYTPSVRSSAGPRGGAIAVPDGNTFDGETSLTLSAGALDGPREIIITELDPEDAIVPPGTPPAETFRPAAIYRFEPEGLEFNKPAKLQLLFQDIDNDGILDGTGYPITSLKVLWWDGFEWRLINSNIDKAKKLVSASIRHFSYYAVFPVGALNDDDYRCKEKIITPNGDGQNDYAFFGILGEGDVANIYNLSGKRVRRITSAEMAWDGRDDDGALVPSGMYMYQVKIPGKTISGTIVVAK